MDFPSSVKKRRAWPSVLLYVDSCSSAHQQWCQVLVDLRMEHIRYGMVAQVLIKNDFENLEQLRGCEDDIPSCLGVQELTWGERDALKQLAKSVRTLGADVR